MVSGVKNYGTVRKNGPTMLIKEEKVSILEDKAVLKDRHETELLWKEDNPNLHHNRQLAVQRL